MFAFLTNDHIHIVCLILAKVGRNIYLKIWQTMFCSCMLLWSMFIMMSVFCNLLLLVQNKTILQRKKYWHAFFTPLENVDNDIYIEGVLYESKKVTNHFSPRPYRPSRVIPAMSISSQLRPYRPSTKSQIMPDLKEESITHDTSSY